MSADAAGRRRVSVFRAAVYGVTTLLILGIAIATTAGPIVRGQDVGRNVVIFVLMLLVASFMLFRCTLAWRQARRRQR